MAWQTPPPAFYPSPRVAIEGAAEKRPTWPHLARMAMAVQTR
jgi:hypothetical protein